MIYEKLSKYTLDPESMEAPYVRETSCGETPHPSTLATQKRHTKWLRLKKDYENQYNVMFILNNGI